MRYFRVSAAVLALGCALTSVGCKKVEPATEAAKSADPAAATAPGAAAAPGAAPAPAAAPPAPAPGAAETPNPGDPATAAGAPASASLSVLRDLCPAAGEDPAACPAKPAAVDKDIQIAHVLIGWKGSLPIDVAITKPEALTLATKVAHDARKPGADFMALVWQHSKDPGPGVYHVTADTRGKFVPPFTAMAESLGIGQVDVVETSFGFHVMKRLPADFVSPEKPIEKVITDACPGDGEDAAACPTAQDPPPTATKVAHILIGFAGSLPGTPVTRTKDEAKALAIKLCHDARKKGADFETLMKANTQDPGPGTYPVDKDAGLVPPFKSLGLALGKGQVDIVETSFGYHVMKRVE
ncbi:MAG: hypothetical protein EXR79_05045 [Myxococcales bacterium]|nr:hypothetical protein [Myxococcales bacterium]